MNSVVSLPKTPTDIPRAVLPATYEKARMAIEECDRVDECKDWANKAAALKAYAAMRDDRALHNFALRIQLRAERRCGELLKSIPRGDEATRYGQVGTDPPVNRSQMAAEAGLSERQRKTAMRIASIPPADFDAQVDSESPPSVTKLADAGKTLRFVPDPGVDEPTDGWQARNALLQISQFCLQHDPASVADGISAGQTQTWRQTVHRVNQWLDRFVSCLDR